MKIILTNAYFDRDDIKEPVKYFYDNRLNEKVISGFSKTSTIHIKKVDYEIKENILYNSKPKEGDFYKIGNIGISLSNIENDIVGQFRFTLDYEHEKYYSKVFSI